MLRSTIMVLILALQTSMAFAGTDECKLISDAAARLDCFDKGGMEKKDDQPKQPEATTKDIVAATPNSPPQLVDPEDLYVSPRKYIGKRVEVKKVQCFYADKDEYRCIAVSHLPVVIFGITVSPPEAKAKLERDCGQIKKVDTPGCRRTIRFSPFGADQDSATILQKRTVMVTREIEIVDIAPDKRRGK